MPLEFFAGLGVGLIAGACIGTISMGLLTARRVDETVAEQSAKRDALRYELQGVDWPLGKIQQAVADSANVDIATTSKVLEAVRALPRIAHSLGFRHRTQPGRCADPDRAEMWAKLTH